MLWKGKAGHWCGCCVAAVVEYKLVWYRSRRRRRDGRRQRAAWSGFGFCTVRESARSSRHLLPGDDLFPVQRWHRFVGVKSRKFRPVHLPKRFCSPLLQRRPVLLHCVVSLACWLQSRHSTALLTITQPNRYFQSRRSKAKRATCRSARVVRRVLQTRSKKSHKKKQRQQSAPWPIFPKNA